MKYTFEAYKEDGSPRKFAGMFRPPNFMTNLGGYVACSCGQILQTIHQTNEHYQMGHFDAALYEDEE